jgi:HAMP domain-containing protein
VAELVPTIVTAAVGVLLLVLVALVVARPVRRFSRARARLAHEVHTGVTQLRAIAYERGKRHPAA